MGRVIIGAAMRAHRLAIISGLAVACGAAPARPVTQAIDTRTDAGAGAAVALAAERERLDSLAEILARARDLPAATRAEPLAELLDEIGAAPAGCLDGYATSAPADRDAALERCQVICPAATALLASAPPEQRWATVARACDAQRYGLAEGDEVLAWRGLVVLAAVATWYGPARARLADGDELAARLDALTAAVGFPAPPPAAGRQLVPSSRHGEPVASLPVAMVTADAVFAVTLPTVRLSQGGLSWTDLGGYPGVPRAPAELTPAAGPLLLLADVDLPAAHVRDVVLALGGTRAALGVRFPGLAEGAQPHVLPMVAAGEVAARRERWLVVAIEAGALKIGEVGLPRANAPALAQEVFAANDLAGLERRVAEAVRTLGVDEVVLRTDAGASVAQLAAVLDVLMRAGIRLALFVPPEIVSPADFLDRDATVSAGLPAASVKQVLRDLKPKLVACYHRRAGEEEEWPDPTGELVVELTIDARGRVSQASASGIDGDLEACGATLARKQRFAAPEGVASVQVRYFYRFPPYR